MNLTELQNQPLQNNLNALPIPVPPPPPPPPPPPAYRPLRPGAKRPCGEYSSDAALRSPLRERKKPQYMKFERAQEKAVTPPRKPMAIPSPQVFSPKKGVSPPVSPKVHSSKSKKRKDRHHRHRHHRHHHQKEKENPESSKEDSGQQDSGGNGKSPIPTAKSPAAPSPSGSDPEGPQDLEKTSSPIVCFIRLCYYTSFISFVAVFLLWLMAAADALHFLNIEFMENKFMGT